jgi:acetyl-CoA carboxylase biotin carboxyl carrier protein
MTDERGGSRELIEAVWAEARELVKRLEGTSVVRFAVAAGGTQIEIERDLNAAGGAPAAAAGGVSVAAGAAPEAAPAADDSRHAINAPLVGTFYRSPSPGADPFVKVGDVVERGQTVAIVEAMKLMNQVTADAKGRVAEILVEDGQWVEFEQALILLEVDDGAGE